LPELNPGPSPQLSATGEPRTVSQAGSERAGFALLRAVVRAEWGYALLLLTAFVLPATFVGYRAWVPALGIAALMAAAAGWLSGRRPLVPAALVGYLLIYTASGLHSDPDTFSLIEAGKYFAPPVFALAIAWAAVSANVRRALVLMAIAALAIQLPVVIGQVIDLVIRYGSSAFAQVDSISGMLGSEQGGALTQVAIAVATVVIAAGCSGVLGRRTAIGGAVALLSLAVLTSTRASYVLVPGVLLVLAASVWLAGRSVGGSRLPAPALAVAAILSMPALILATGALYPGSNTGIDSISGLVTSLDEGDQQLAAVKPLTPSASHTSASGTHGTHGSHSGTKPTKPVPPPQLTTLPGRGKQLTLALDLSDDKGVVTALLGRGIGSTRFKDDSVLSDRGETTDPITRPEQNTNGTWLARTITETGYLGLLAFLGLLAYLVVLFWRNRNLLGEPSWDAAVILALPAIAALTLGSAAYNTILAIQPFATIFWALLGIAIAIDLRNRRRET
jgi:hypothetical protein